MAILTQFTNILPLFEITHDQSLRWLALCHSYSAYISDVGEHKNEIDWYRLFQRYGVKESQISSRRSECSDVVKSDEWDKKVLFNLKPGQLSGVDIEQRNIFFAKRAEDIFTQFYEADSAKPNHLVHVTCTGYISPSAPQQLVANRGWSGDVGVTHAYHMGCYAALPAIRLAAALANQLDRVDIIHTEMCTIHMNPALHSPEQMVVQSLFADGHIKYSVTEKLPAGEKIGLRLLCLREWILPNSGQDMTWIPAANGMQMTLSREVPSKITSVLRDCFFEMMKHAGLNSQEVLKNGVFAIHPGGPKIISAVEKCLELLPNQTKQSHEVLRTRGNMSSATLPHIWELILKSNPKAGTKIISFAFGPGLTIFASTFEVVSQ